MILILKLRDITSRSRYFNAGLTLVVIISVIKSFCFTHAVSIVLQQGNGSVIQNGTEWFNNRRTNGRRLDADSFFSEMNSFLMP